MSKIPDCHLAALARITDSKSEVYIEKNFTRNLSPLLRNLQCKRLYLSDSPLDFEETVALVEGMEAGVKEVIFFPNDDENDDNNSTVLFSTEAMKMYSGNGTCRRLDVLTDGMYHDDEMHYSKALEEWAKEKKGWQWTHEEQIEMSENEWTHNTEFGDYSYFDDYTPIITVSCNNEEV